MRLRARDVVSLHAILAAVALVSGAIVPRIAVAQARPSVSSATTDDDDDDDEDDAETPPSSIEHPPPAYRPPRTAVWLAPVMPIAGPIALDWVNFNSGVSRSLSRGLDLVIEGGLGYSSRNNAPHDYTGGLSIGTSFFISGSLPMNGFFVTPKIQFSFGPDQRGYSAAFLGFGFDVGFQFVRGPFFISPLIGVLYNAEIPTSGLRAPVSFASGINLELLRIGVALDGRGGSNEAREHWVSAVTPGERGLDFANDHAPKHIAIWFLPAWMAIGPILDGSHPRYNVGLGATIPIVPHVQVVAQGGYEWGSRPGIGARADYHSFQGALGFSFVVTRSPPLHGLFFDALLYTGEDVYGRRGGLASTLTAGVEADIGYQFNAGPIYIAPVLGVRLGATAILAPEANTSRGSAQPSGFTPDVNLSFLRMGIAL